MASMSSRSSEASLKAICAVTSRSARRRRGGPLVAGPRACEMTKLYFKTEKEGLSVVPAG